MSPPTGRGLTRLPGQWPRRPSLLPVSCLLGHSSAFGSALILGLLLGWSDLQRVIAILVNLLIVCIADLVQGRGLIRRSRTRLLRALAENERFLIPVLACLRLFGCLRVRVLNWQIDQSLLQYLLIELYQITTEVQESHVSLFVLLVHQL